jgi:hypothetical protein
VVDVAKTALLPLWGSPRSISQTFSFSLRFSRVLVEDDPVIFDDVAVVAQSRGGVRVLLDYSSAIFGAEPTDGIEHRQSQPRGCGNGRASGRTLPELQRPFADDGELRATEALCRDVRRILVGGPALRGQDFLGRLVR